jgi:hypothetical protein
MFKLRAYIKFRKLGLSRFKAFDLANYIDMTLLDKIIILGSIVSILLVFIGTFYSFDVKADNVYSNAIKYQAQAYKYEQALIGCLSGAGIIIDGRNMNCEVKEYK